MAAMLEFNLKVKGTKELQAGFHGLTGQLQDWRAAWPKVSAKLVNALAQQFEVQGASGAHQGWAPLSQEYARRKQKVYPGRPMLQASTRLWQSLVGKTRDTVEEHDLRTLRFGTRLDYARYLHSGTGKGVQRTSVPTGRGTGRGMPQRAIFDLLPEHAAGIASEIKRQALDFAQGLGFRLANDHSAVDRAGRMSLSESL